MYQQAQLIAVLLPGIDGTGRMFGPLIDQLPAWLRPLVLDYPTHEQLSYPELANRLAARLPQDTPFIIIAESFAGPLALLLSETGNPQLKALVLCATFVSNPRPWLSKLAPLVLHEWVMAQPPRKWMARLFVTGDAPEELLDKALAIHKTVSPRVTLRRLQEVLAVDVREIFTHCQIPLLHLYAQHDRLITRYPTRELQRLRPDVPSIAIDGPHFLLQTRSAICYRAIEHFLIKQVLPPADKQYSRPDTRTRPFAGFQNK